MKPGSKTRTRRTLGGGTKTVTRTKSSTGAKTRTVERSKGNYQTGMETSRKVRRADKSGVSKMKSKTFSRTNVEHGSSLRKDKDKPNSYVPNASVATAKTSSQVLKNTFRKKGSLRKENRDLSYSSRSQNVGADVEVKYGKSFNSGRGFNKQDEKGNYTVRDVERSVKESPNKPKAEMKTKNKTTRISGGKHSIPSSKRGLNRSAKKHAKEHFEAVKSGMKNLKQMSTKEALHMKGAKQATHYTPHGPTNKQFQERNPHRTFDFSKEVETGKTYTPKRK